MTPRGKHDIGQNLLRSWLVGRAFYLMATSHNLNRWWLENLSFNYNTIILENHRILHLEIRSFRTCGPLVSRYDCCRCLGTTWVWDLRWRIADATGIKFCFITPPRCLQTFPYHTNEYTLSRSILIYHFSLGVTMVSGRNCPMRWTVLHVLCTELDYTMSRHLSVVSIHNRAIVEVISPLEER